MNLTTEKQGFVYIIHAIGTNQIKVCYSTSPHERLKTLQTGSAIPLKMLACWPGTMERERRVHRYLQQFRQIGEWFTAPPFIGLQIYELVTKGTVTGRVAFSEARIRSKPKSELLITQHQSMQGLNVDDLAQSACARLLMASKTRKAKTLNDHKCWLRKYAPVLAASENSAHKVTANEITEWLNQQPEKKDETN